MMKVHRYRAQIGRNSRLRLASMSLCLLLLSAVAGVCTSSGQEASQASPQSPPSSYRLQPGDSIEVFYRLTPEYNQVTNILPDGYVDLRLLGAIHLGGLDVAEAHEAITAEANKRLKNPEISLSVVDFVPDHFEVIGEVSKPGRYELRGPTTAVEALAMAGAFVQESAQRSVILVRPLGPGSEYGEATVIDFKALRRLNATTKLPMIRNGDVLIVPSSRLGKVERFMRLANIGLYYSPLPPI